VHADTRSPTSRKLSDRLPERRAPEPFEVESLSRSLFLSFHAQSAHLFSLLVRTSCVYFSFVSHLKKRTVVRHLIRNTMTRISSQNPVLTPCTFLKKCALSFSTWPFSMDNIPQKQITDSEFSFQTIVGFENVRCSCNVKERKSALQMIMSGARTSGIERWQW